MKSTLAMLLILTLAAAILTAGCNGRKESGSSSGASAGTSVKTTEEYRQDAERQITKDNAEGELKKLEAEINSDAE